MVEREVQRVAILPKVVTLPERFIYLPFLGLLQADWDIPVRNRKPDSSLKKTVRIFAHMNISHIGWREVISTRRRHRAQSFTST